MLGSAVGNLHAMRTHCPLCPLWWDICGLCGEGGPCPASRAVFRSDPRSTPTFSVFGTQETRTSIEQYASPGQTPINDREYVVEVSRSALD